MKLLSRKSLIGSVILAILICQSRQQCEIMCYTNAVTSQASCSICYQECKDPSITVFTSCHYYDSEVKEFKDLNEEQCSSYCYPQAKEEVQVITQLSEKLNVDIDPSLKQKSLYALSSEEFKRQLKKQQRQADLIAFAMIIACALFTVIATLIILSYLDKKDSNTSTAATTTLAAFAERQQKILPQTNSESLSSFSDQINQVQQTI